MIRRGTYDEPVKVRFTAQQQFTIEIYFLRWLQARTAWVRVRVRVRVRVGGYRLVQGVASGYEIITPES